MFSIKHLKGLDKNYYGYSSAYEINFQFQKQKAVVTLQIWDNEPNNRCRLSSDTDGYHWLQFFLSQEPGTDQLKENRGFDTEVGICQSIFAAHYIQYEQEGKDTAYLTWNKDINMEFAELVANIIEPRFANRERFF